MALSPKKEVNRLPGYAISRNADGTGNPEILAGQLVRMVDALTITRADGSLADASNHVLGVALDTTSLMPSSASFTVTDSFAKNGLVGVMVGGGVIEVWNDGRGIVFEADCIGAPVGEYLYVSSGGNWTTTKDGTSTHAGNLPCGQILQSPTSASDSLVLKLLV